MHLTIAPLTAADRAPWEALARGYKSFYKTDVTAADMDRAWHRLLAEDGVFGVGAKLDGELLGIGHYLFHTSVWAPTTCYLQDLFVAPAARGQGLARALIGAVADAARQRQASRCYWLTQDDNVTARRLYDKVARFNGFIRYDLALD
ncbi:MAG: GNAT family N-acetyltransferase [Rubrivivax sp.]|nr:GNAT family N-acetyltransferase [Rubrivivax sp.]